ncbi:MAG: NMD3-related protein [archaeon]
MICPVCGKEKGDFYKGLCIECNLKKVKLEYPSKIEIKRCKNCGNIFYKGKFTNMDWQKIGNIILKKVKTSLFDPRIIEKQGKYYLTGFLDERKVFPVEIELNLNLIFSDVICENCAKMSSKSFDFLIQLRMEKEFNAERFAAIKNFILERMKEIKDNKAKAFWYTESKYGYDFYFGFKDIGEEIFKEICKKFKTKGTRAYQMKGLNKHGKKKIKVTACFRA